MAGETKEREREREREREKCWRRIEEEDARSGTRDQIVDVFLSK
jgi:hypothetical protein